MDAQVALFASSQYHPFLLLHIHRFDIQGLGRVGVGVGEQPQFYTPKSPGDFTRTAS